MFVITHWRGWADGGVALRTLGSPGTLMLTHWTAPVICETDEADEIIRGIINTMMLR